MGRSSFSIESAPDPQNSRIILIAETAGSSTGPKILKLHFFFNTETEVQISPLQPRMLPKSNRTERLSQDKSPHIWELKASTDAVSKINP